MTGRCRRRAHKTLALTLPVQGDEEVSRKYVYSKPRALQAEAGSPERYIEKDQN